ncbi:MAG: endonuclease [Pirellulales bacterium]|nr:endonuclease [Pirellulales bacterium]
MRPATRTAAVYLLLTLVVASARAQSFDPPANYYSTATGTGATLKQQLNDVIDGHTIVSYDNARFALQVTDEDPNDPNRLILVYNRVSLNTANINPGGPIPGWNGTTWNREHTWPDSRLPGGSAVSDLFNLRPSTNSVNSDRGNLNFGGAFGQQSFGVLTDKGAQVWYPGNADAGMIARQEFYMSVRYGTDSGSSNLQLINGAPSDGNNSLGDLARLIEWHYAAPPDSFERRRNQIIYDQYQHNRNPFTDRPEYAWSVFVNQTNDSSLGLQGGTPTGSGATSLNIDLGRVLVGAAVPAAQTVTLNKAGLNGTYYQVTAAGQATSSVSGRYNAFATGATGSKSINVGLATTTATAGLRSGAVTLDNLDVTTAGGGGRGANDGNDVINVSLSVLSHANPSFSGAGDVNSLTYDFGTVTLGAPAPTFGFDIFNLPTTVGFTAGLDLDLSSATGDASTLAANITPFAGVNTLPAGVGSQFTATFDTSAVGSFSASYTLAFSDEDLPGATSLAPMSLTLTGVIEPATVAEGADFDSDGDVDGGDFLAWQQGLGTAGAMLSDGDANDDQIVDGEDLTVWTSQFGQTPGTPAQVVPEPTAAWLGIGALAAAAAGARRRSSRPRVRSQTT